MEYDGGGGGMHTEEYFAGDMDMSRIANGGSKSSRSDRSGSRSGAHNYNRTDELARKRPDPEDRAERVAVRHYKKMENLDRFFLEKQFPQLRNRPEAHMEGLQVIPRSRPMTERRHRVGDFNGSIVSQPLYTSDKDMLNAYRVEHLSRTASSIRGAVRGGVAPEPVFHYVNRQHAKDETDSRMNGATSAFHGCGYDDHFDFTKSEEKQRRQRLEGRPRFYPSSTARAKDLLVRDCYMYGPDQVTKEQMLQMTRKKALENSQKFISTLYARRSPRNRSSDGERPISRGRTSPHRSSVFLSKYDGYM